MALEVQTVVNNAHEHPITSITYNRARCELYSGAQDNLIKVRMYYRIGIVRSILTEWYTTSARSVNSRNSFP
eukprot:6216632-Pyramimonas_sp.AAC.4